MRALLVPPQDKSPEKRYGPGTLLALTAARWSVTGADPSRMLLNFEILSGSSLSFLINKAEGLALIEAIRAAITSPAFEAVPPKASQN